MAEDWATSIPVWRVSPAMSWMYLEYAARGQPATVIIDREADRLVGNERFWAFWHGQPVGTYPTEEAARQGLREM